MRTKKQIRRRLNKLWKLYFAKNGRTHKSARATLKKRIGELEWVLELEQ